MIQKMSKTDARLCPVAAFRRGKGPLVSSRRHECCLLTRFQPICYRNQAEIKTLGLPEFLHINDYFASHTGAKGRLKQDPWHGYCKDAYDELAKLRDSEKNPTKPKQYE